MESRNGDDFRGTDRFDVRRRVGAGGMGVVYEAYDRDRDMRVAIKTILNVDASLLYRFKKEFRSLSDVSHPNLVKLYELILHERISVFTRWSSSRGWTSSGSSARRIHCRRRIP